MTKEHFNQIEPLWLFGKPDEYGEADAANMEHCAEFVQMRCDGDITVAQARALRDWLNTALPVGSRLQPLPQTNPARFEVMPAAPPPVHNDYVAPGCEKFDE